MSQQLVEPIKQQLNLKASQILRQTTVEQCKNYFSMDGKFCAIGAMMHYFGWDGTPSESYYRDGFNGLGISGVIWGDVVRLNDIEHKSFAEIADYLESIGL